MKMRLSLRCGLTGRAHPRRGVASALVVIASTALLGMLALTVDLGMLHIARQQLQNGADAAALAGAGQLRQSTDGAEIAAEAVAMAHSNLVLGRPLQLDAARDVQIGYRDAGGAWVTGWPATGLPMVRVTARRTAGTTDGPVPMTFARLFGVETVDVAATAIASVSGGQIGRQPVEIVITQDVSQSFAEEIEIAKDADGELVRIVNTSCVAGDRIGVVRFRGSANRPLSLTSADADVNVVYSAVNGITLGSDLASGTNTAAGLQNATEMLLSQAAADTDRIIVLVSDGMPNGEAEYVWNPVLRRYVLVATAAQVTAELRQDAIDAADAAAAAGITIHTVTFIQDGSDGDAEFNASLARNGGFAFDTPDPDDLEGILRTVGHIEVGHPVLVE